MAWMKVSRSPRDTALHEQICLAGSLSSTSSAPAPRIFSGVNSEAGSSTTEPITLATTFVGSPTGIPPLKVQPSSVFEKKSLR